MNVQFKVNEFKGTFSSKVNVCHSNASFKCQNHYFYRKKIQITSSKVNTFSKVFGD